MATSSDCTFEISVEYGHGSAADTGPTERDAASAAPMAADCTFCWRLRTGVEERRTPLCSDNEPAAGA